MINKCICVLDGDACLKALLRYKYAKWWLTTNLKTGLFCSVCLIPHHSCQVLMQTGMCLILNVCLQHLRYFTVFHACGNTILSFRIWWQPVVSSVSRSWKPFWTCGKNVVAKSVYSYLLRPFPGCNLHDNTLRASQIYSSSPRKANLSLNLRKRISVLIKMITAAHPQWLYTVYRK